jgi:hypothetical protein
LTRRSIKEKRRWGEGESIESIRAESGRAKERDKRAVKEQNNNSEDRKEDCNNGGKIGRIR